MEPLSALLRAVADAQGIDQAAIARLTGLSSTTVGNVWNRRAPYGNRLPSIDTQQRCT